MGKNTIVKHIDYSNPDKTAEMKKLEREIEESRERQRLEDEKSREEERLQEEQETKELTKIYQEMYKKKQRQSPPPYKPSRMLSVEADVMLANVEKDMGVLRENINYMENMLWEIMGFLYKKNKKKLESLKLKKMKRLSMSR